MSINTIILLLFTFDIVFAFVYYFFYPQIYGIAGEYWVKKELRRLSAEYIVLNDIMIANNGKTTQIDHIVISPYGIFVIETKHYHGFIRGGDAYKMWRQYYGKSYHEFYNPTRQNYGHTVALSQQLDLPMDQFVPIICFTAQVKLKIDSRSHVVHIYELGKTIRQYRDIIVQQPTKIVHEISSLNITDKTARRQHIERVKKLNDNLSSTRKPQMSEILRLSGF